MKASRAFAAIRAFPGVVVLVGALLVAVLAAAQHCELSALARASVHACCEDQPSPASHATSACCIAVVAALPATDAAPLPALADLGAAWTQILAALLPPSRPADAAPTAESPPGLPGFSPLAFARVAPALAPPFVV